MKYPFVVVTDSINPLHLASSKGPVIFVRPRYKDDAAIRAHEMTHIRQFFMLFLPLLAVAGYLYSIGSNGWFVVAMISLLAHNMLYEFSRPYRCWAEVRAYRSQAMGNDAMLLAFAQALAAFYDLGITPAQALALLEGK